MANRFRKCERYVYTKIIIVENDEVITDEIA